MVTPVADSGSLFFPKILLFIDKEYGQMAKVKKRKDLD
jgi:hypothetical protein